MCDRWFKSPLAIHFGKAVLASLAVIATSQVLFAAPLNRISAGSSREFGVAMEIRIVALRSELMHFSLLGPDWAKIPQGYSGVTPETVIAELNIPAEYVVRRKQPAQTTNVSIAFLYPSMKGAAYESPQTRIGGIITSGREDFFRKGVHSIIFRDGVTHDPSLDGNELCGYVDHIHVGYAGDELYTSCKEMDQTFSIVCFPPLNRRRICTSENYLEDNLSGQLIYQYSTLREHVALLEAFRTLVISFIQARPDN